MSNTVPHNRLRYLPWRSATAGWTATALVLVAGVPLFLCMPPWNDVTLHDMAARSILRGGVHYRDVFDTNLPGIDWSMALVRLAFGWSFEALRAVDLLAIAAEIAILLLWVRRAGGARYTIAWFAAAAALFYPFTSEFNHVQRDPWLLLPALGAAWLRLSRTIKPMLTGCGHSPECRVEPSSQIYRSGFWRSVAEGVVWGAAVWVKPHVIIPAGVLWIFSALVSARRVTRRQIALDLAGLIAGGLLAGALGVLWMVRTGAWPYFLDVFLNWNPSYLADMWSSAPNRMIYTFYCFRPWSILHCAAIPLAIISFWEARLLSVKPTEPRRMLGETWIYASAGTEAVATARALLAAFYLGWFFQAINLQKGFDYVQVPLLFLAMAVIATHRWAFGFAYLIWFVVLAAILNLPALNPVARSIEERLPSIRAIQDPLTDFQIMQLWPRCWVEGGSPELR